LLGQRLPVLAVHAKREALPVAVEQTRAEFAALSACYA
jgi:hypothetical protein